MPRLLVLEFVVLAALWGSSFLFMRIGATELGTWPTAGLRVALAAVFLLPTFAVAGVWADFKQHAKPILFVGLLNSAIPFGMFAFAVMHISTGLTAILNATVPLWGAVIAWAWLRDQPSGSRWLGLAIGFAGVCALVLGKSNSNASGQLLNTINPMSLIAMGAALVATLCYGIAASFTRRYLGGVKPLAITTGSQIGAALGLAVPMLWFWPSEPVSGAAWGAMAAVALLGTALAYMIFFHVIAQVGPSKALTVTFLIPVFALIYGATFLGEVITPWMVGCGAVILVGTALSTGLVSWPRRRASA
jgi:drug/metabolite transporter (DMT)-like permease